MVVLALQKTKLKSVAKNGKLGVTSSHWIINPCNNDEAV